MQLVGGADAREDAIRQADGGGFGGDEAAGMGQQHDQRDLADIGALARHVRPGDEGKRG